jgi:peptide-methionine (S)-S-oxide reductase
MATTSQAGVLAGGGFWGVQGFVGQEPGVITNVVGYTGDEIPNETYRNRQGQTLPLLWEGDQA